MTMTACCRAVIALYRKLWGGQENGAALFCPRCHRRVVLIDGAWRCSSTASPQQETPMKKSKQSQPKAKKISIAEAFKMWMSGIGRGKLVAQTGLTKGELHQQFVKVSGKKWSELNAERKGSKKSSAKEGLRRKAA